VTGRETLPTNLSAEKNCVGVGWRKRAGGSDFERELMGIAPTDISLCRHGKLGKVFFWIVYLLSWIGALAILSRHAWADTFIVTTLEDTDDGNYNVLSLREAIKLANENPSCKKPCKDIINFNTSGTIFVGSGNPAGEALPVIDDPVIIDGTCKPGSALEGKPCVVLDGKAVTGNGLFVWGGAGSEFRGLVIKNFPSSGILLYGGNNLIQGNYIGTDDSGTLAAANGAGITISVANDNKIIGNVISGNKGAGIGIYGNGPTNNNQIVGNFIGTDVNGTGKLGNAMEGVFLQWAKDNVIGGNVISNNGGSGVVITFDAQYNVIEGNVISNNGGSGVVISGGGGTGYTLGNKVQGNFIGTNKAGAQLPNALHGVHIEGNTQINTIGGIKYRLGSSMPVADPNAANTIAFNKGSGVFVDSAVQTFRHTIRGNSIFNNAGLGIDLAPDGVNPNDDLDGDDGPNRLQNFPSLQSAVSYASSTIVKISFNGEPSKQLSMDFYANDLQDPSGHGEGQKFLASIPLTTNSNGFISTTVTLPAVPAGKYITATATDGVGNTSEFSNAVKVSLQKKPKPKPKKPKPKYKKPLPASLLKGEASGDRVDMPF